MSVKSISYNDFKFDVGTTPSDTCLIDKKNAYCDGESMDINASDEVYFADTKYDRHYVYEPKNGGVYYLNGVKFDSANEPYVPINEYLYPQDKVKYVLFASKNGIFYMSMDAALNMRQGNFITQPILDTYYSFNSGRLNWLKRAGDNPFKGKVRQISSRVLKDEQAYYYINFYDVEQYGHLRHSKYLSKRTNFIELYRLINLGVKDEKVVAQIAHNMVQNPEKSQLIFCAKDVVYNFHSSFYIHKFFIFLILVALCCNQAMKIKKARKITK